MQSLKNFVPQKFNKLTTEKKIAAMRKLASEIFKELGLKPIPILISDIESEKTIGGVFVKNPPPYICINSFFFDDDKIKEVFSDSLAVNSFVPYYFVNVISHECYHYYQYCLINRLANGESLSNAEKKEAYLSFISLYEKVFYVFCEQKGILPESNLTREEIYNFSPAELNATEYAKTITKRFQTVDPCLDNLIEYSNIMALTDPNLYSKDSSVDVIRHCLNVALSFLSYKNSISGSKEKYLGIDEEELKETIEEIIKEKENSLLGMNKLLSKLSRK